MRFGISPVQALSEAFDDTVALLFRPFDPWRWIKLSIVCLFLGGGTPSAAFNWSLGSLPGDIGFQAALARVRQYVAEHFWLIILAGALGLGLALVFLYLRAALRFVLVDAILKQEVHLRQAWSETRSIGRSYFRWLLGALAVVGLALLGGALAAYPYLRAAAAGGVRSVAFWATLVGVLMTDILVGLALAVVIVLTDDLAVPIMYAERLTLPAAWVRLGHHLRAEAGAFTVYVLLRLAVAVATSVAVLVFLFSALLGLFSGAIITGALVVLTLRLMGLLWSWNAFTMTLAAAGLAMLLSLVLIVLSVVGMPAQVFLQGFGMRFIASRMRSLEVLFRPAFPDGEPP